MDAALHFVYTFARFEVVLATIREKDVRQPRFEYNHHNEQYTHTDTLQRSPRLRRDE